MNGGRIARHYRHRQGGQVARNICLRCFQFGHRKGPHCRNDPLVTCGKCYRAYIFTTDCSCERSTKEDMTLRLVAGTIHPRPVIDVTVGIKTFEAFINMSIERTTINLDVLRHINECNRMINVPNVANQELVEYPIRRRYRQAILQLQIHEHQNDPIILGMDYFMIMGFDLTTDRVTINQRSPVLACSKTVDFLYNRPEGSNLRTWLEENNRPMYQEYQKEEQPQIQEEQRVFIENEQIDEERDADILELHAAEEDLLSD